MWAPSREMARRAAERRSPYYSAINVSAFASVAVVILFLFLTNTINFHDLGPGAVDLPKAQFLQLEPGALREDAITVTVARDGKLFLRSTQISLEELPALVRRALKEGSERKAYLRADAKARNSDIEVAVAGIRAGGISTIAIICRSRQ
jgi:biopolymer transport protein TolR